MKTALASLLVGLAVITPGCSGKVETQERGPTPITPVSIEQVQKLFPYMTEVKKVGGPVRRTSEVKLSNGQMLVQYWSSQTFTFSVWVDENHHPVMPPTEGELVAMRRRATKNNGTWDSLCFGGCTPNTSGGDPCVRFGCDSLDDSCGCTPLDCPGCEVIDCILGGGGALAGSLVMM